MDIFRPTIPLLTPPPPIQQYIHHIQHVHIYKHSTSSTNISIIRMAVKS